MHLLGIFFKYIFFISPVVWFTADDDDDGKTVEQKGINN